MMFARYFSSTRARQSHIDIVKQIDRIKASNVPDLPFEDTIALSSQDLSGRVTIDQEKSPLVIIHGLFGARQNYASVGRQISALTQRQTIGVDMRNHGASSHVFPHDYPHMAKDTIHFIESMDRKVVLAGHSMGAKVSMLVALQRPDLVEKLIVIDNSPVAEKLDARFTRDLLAMCQVEQELHSQGKNQAKLLKDVDQVMAPYESDALVRVFLASNLKRPKKAGNSERVKFRVPVANFLKHDVMENLGDWPSDMVKGLVFEKPVLVMRGLQSNFVQTESLQSHFPAFFPNFETEDFGCGHWLVSEQPEKFVEKTVRFTEGS